MPVREEMDIELLIREVQTRPAIWDQKCLHYYNREVVSKMWREIASACGVPSEAVRCKWKHLRDNFRKEFKKTLRDRTRDPGNPDKPGSNWVWFQSLQFLGEQLSSKKLSSKFSFHSLKEESLQDEGEETDSGAMEDEGQFTVSDGDCSQSLYVPDTGDLHSQKQFLQSMKLVGNLSRKRYRYDSTESDLESQSKRQQLLEHLFHREKDDTYHFLMSLMTPLKSLPFDRQMFVRFKMQELIFNETFQSNGTSCLKPKNENSSLAAIASLQTHHGDGSADDAE